MKKLLIASLILAGTFTMLAAPRFDAKAWSTVQKYDVRTLSRNVDSHIGELVEIASWYKFKRIQSGATKILHRFQRALEQLSPEEKLGMDIAAKQRIIASRLSLVSSKCSLVPLLSHSVSKRK